MRTSPTLSHLKVQKYVMVKYVKNYEKSEILPYFQVNELAWYSFMDAGRGHETPGSGTKLHHPYHKQHELSAYISSLFPRCIDCNVYEPGSMLYTQRVYVIKCRRPLISNNELEANLLSTLEGSTISIILDGKQIFHLPEKTLSLSFTVICWTSLKRILGGKSYQCLFSTGIHPWRNES